MPIKRGMYDCKGNRNHESSVVDMKLQLVSLMEKQNCCGNAFCLFVLLYKTTVK